MDAMARRLVVMGACIAVVAAAWPGGAAVPGSSAAAVQLEGKEPRPQEQVVDLGEPSAENACIAACLHENQMAAVGFEILLRQCLESCRVTRALELVGSPDRKRYRKGVLTLCATTDPRAVEPLVEALRKDLRERTGLWAWIIPALGNLRAREAVPLLITILNDLDEDWPGREASARALGAIGDRAAVPALAAAALRADTREAAILALAGFDDPRIVGPLLEAIQEDEDPGVRRAAVERLRRLGPAAVPALVEALGEYNSEFPDTAKRVEICSLLGQSGAPEALQRLRSARSDPDPAVAACAARFTDEH